MHKSTAFLVFLALAATTALAQQELPPTADGGPLQIHQAPPQPDKDGIYAVVPGITGPIVLKRVAAAYPANPLPPPPSPRSVKSN